MPLVGLSNGYCDYQTVTQVKSGATKWWYTTAIAIELVQYIRPTTSGDLTKT